MLPTIMTVQNLLRTMTENASLQRALMVPVPPHFVHPLRIRMQVAGCRSTLCTRAQACFMREEGLGVCKLLSRSEMEQRRPAGYEPTHFRECSWAALFYCSPSAGSVCPHPDRHCPVFSFIADAHRGGTHAQASSDFVFLWAR